MNKNKSTTRRVLALIFAGVGAGVLCKLAIGGNSEALIALISIVSLIMGFYFGAKANSLE